MSQPSATLQVMKKIVLYGCATFIFIAILLAVFWQSITATLAWYVLSYTTSDNGALYLIPIPAATLQPTDFAGETLRFNTLHVPVLASSTVQWRNSSSTVVVTLDNRNAAYYVGTITPFASEFVRNPNLSTDYKERLCVKREASINPCESNQGFIQTLLTTSPETVSLFSFRTKKITHSIFVSLKDLYIAPDTQTIYELKSDTFTGYLTYSPTTSLAFLFTADGAGYELSFLSMSEGEVLEILNNTTIKTN